MASKYLFRRSARAVRLFVQKVASRVRKTKKHINYWSRQTLRPHLIAASCPRFRGDPSSDVIVSFTSFSPRVPAVWAVIDSLFRQSMRPRAICLVLSETEFPEKRIPRSLVRRVERGLTLLWTTEDQKNFDKLLPAFQKFVDCRIITVDDDRLYERDTIELLISASNSRRDAVIGHRGQAGHLVGGTFFPFQRADANTPSHELVLTGTGGILYPPGSLHADVVRFDLATELGVTSDDVWFWAMSIRAESTRICLGTPKSERWTAQQQTPSMLDINRHTLEQQFATVMDYFGLRGKL